jgi:hypothetical protein
MTAVKKRTGTGLLGLAVSLAFVLRTDTKTVLSAPQQNPSGPAALAQLLPTCAKPQYHPVSESPDRIAKLINGRKKYRLVIGTDQFQYNKNLNRPFVANTAALVDTKLAGLGYEHVGLFGGKPFLSGAAATKEAIRAAVQALAAKAGKNDLGILYFVGHGTITPYHNDLALSVFNRPVEPDEGTRLSDLIGYLTIAGDWRKDVEEIPHFIIVLETCYSGSVLASDSIVTVNGQQRMARLETPLIPGPVALLTATADGDTSRAYELRGIGHSAFGYFFARALGEDWACAETTPDGILTFRELSEYIRLKLTAAAPFLDGPMRPQKLNKDDRVFLAYAPDKVAIPGERESIVTLDVTPQPGTDTTIALMNGFEFKCPPACTEISFSRRLGEQLRVTKSERPIRPGGGARGAPVDLFPPPPPESEMLDLKQLLSDRQMRVLGSTIKLKGS